MAKLIKRKENWYLIDTEIEKRPIENGAVIYADTTPAFARFIDYTEKICYLSGGVGETSFDDLEVIVASTNPLDGTPMLSVEMIENKLLENFIFDTIGGNDFGVMYPDEHDSVIGYYPTMEQCVAILREWFSHKPFPILVKHMYFTQYTIHVENGYPEPLLIDGFVNLLNVTIKAIN